MCPKELRAYFEYQEVFAQPSSPQRGEAEVVETTIPARFDDLQRELGFEGDEGNDVYLSMEEVDVLPEEEEEEAMVEAEEVAPATTYHMMHKLTFTITRDLPQQNDVEILPASPPALMAPPSPESKETTVRKRARSLSSSSSSSLSSSSASEPATKRKNCLHV